MNNSCCVCLEVISEEQEYKKWTCSHKFHKNCITSWNKGCPLCRTTELVNPLKSKNPKNILDLERMKNLNNLVPLYHQSIYKENWNDTECIKDNHSLWLFNNYGVIGICENCNTVQSFNLMH